jgi:hypothetical protein
MDVASNEGAYTDHDPDTRCFSVFEREELGLRSSSSTAAHQDLPYNWSGDVLDFLLGIRKALQHIRAGSAAVILGSDSAHPAAAPTFP